MNAKAKSRAKPKAAGEAREHAALKLAIAKLASACGFSVDAEIHLNFSGAKEDDGRLVDECSADVAAYHEVDGKSCLLLFECKSGTNVDGINKQITNWQASVANIKAGGWSVVASDTKLFSKWDVSGLTEVSVCYVFGPGMPPQRFHQLHVALRRRKLWAWTTEMLEYYRLTAEAIGKSAKYQILRDFECQLDSAGTYEEDAIRLKQFKTEMFVLTMRPADLLKIAYVYRRASGKPKAYQRIVNKDRVQKISEFLSTRNPLLPNAIILAFDSDASRRVNYTKGKLSFPRTYCSAWIIDGQHRVYGFEGSRIVSPAQSTASGNFRLPVVAFKSLSIALQNRSFVSINSNQKKMDPTLLCDLAASLPDLQDPLTWPSLLVTQLCAREPIQGKVKIEELDRGRPITLASFARYALLEGLLGYDGGSGKYQGPLHKYAPLGSRASVSSKANQRALARQVQALERYFVAVKRNTERAAATEDPWRNTRDYALLKPTGINALLLVLCRIMEKYPKLESDMGRSLDAYLSPLRHVRFTKQYVANKGGGWKGFRSLANVMLRKLNADNHDSLRLFGAREKV